MRYIRLLDSLNIPFRCLRDKGPGGSSPEYQGAFTFLYAEIEDYLTDMGFHKLLETARATAGNSKPKVGRYLGENMDASKVPELFLTLLDEILSVAETSEQHGQTQEK